ncbi:DUF2155 domain-containing protein [Desulfuromonas carbonis]|uniref:DUF2155 domain-containing protein n=1 Tax=Desulfuromonas sp. DDH964 TaxID=1823759 RepID=UPI00078D9655|nr:DUF2155 domain-containing protein [Desulfuromonas sp. DDH964]AMV70926.1 lipoprotein [Desulfuromonas sp. DDH964]
MSRPFRLLLPLLLILALLLFGCSPQEEQPAKQAKTAKTSSRVVVPESVQGKWKAVKIAVLDKETQKEVTYTVDIGAAFKVGGGNLQVKVENFLPAFVMDGTTMTSASNLTRNPAAQIVINEDGKELYRGWLFSLYPATHAYQHPRYSFSLVDFVPAKAKKG